MNYSAISAICRRRTEETGYLTTWKRHGESQVQIKSAFEGLKLTGIITFNGFNYNLKYTTSDNTGIIKIDEYRFHDGFSLNQVLTDIFEPCEKVT